MTVSNTYPRTADAPAGIRDICFARAPNHRSWDIAPSRMRAILAASRFVHQSQQDSLLANIA